jgi:hypothetical protein
MKYYNISPIFCQGQIGNGFFSNYRVCLEKLIIYHDNFIMSGTPYINWSNTTFVDGFFDKNSFNDNDQLINPFNYWFDQSIPNIDDELDNFIYSRQIPPIIDHRLHYFDNQQELDLQKKIDALYIKPKKFILDKVDEIYNKELNGHTILGVMVRGSEYNMYHPEYGIFNIDDYLREIDKILAENTKITKLFVVSEETEYVEKITNYFKSSYFVPNVFRRTDETIDDIKNVHWINQSQKRKNHCKLLGEEVIIQTKLLGKCDYLFGKHSGTIAGAILWGENIKKFYKI